MDKTRYIYKLLIIILLNICVIVIARHFVNRRESIPAQAPVFEKSYSGYVDPDYLLLAGLISAESANEPYTAKVAVGAVVLNRVQHPSFPDTVAGVVYQPGAFASVADGGIDGEAAGESAFRAAKEALNGFDPSGGAIYYYRSGETVDVLISERPVTKIIGSLRFCK